MELSARHVCLASKGQCWPAGTLLPSRQKNKLLEGVLTVCRVSVQEWCQARLSGMFSSLGFCNDGANS